jgi:hypothetical protein
VHTGTYPGSNDPETGMAKYLAAEHCRDVVEDSFRIHCGYGYSKELRDRASLPGSPMLLIGEGTSDIQKDDHWPLAPGRLPAQLNARSTGDQARSFELLRALGARAYMFHLLLHAPSIRLAGGNIAQ